MKQIVVKKIDGKHVIYIHESLVIEKTGVTKVYLDTTARRRSVSTGSWEFVKIENVFYYNLATIPNKSPNNYRDKFPSHIDVLHEYMRPERVIADGSAIELIKKEIEETKKVEDIQFFMWESRVTFDNKKATDLAKALAFCRLMQNALLGNTYHRYLLKAQKDFFTECARAVAELELYGLGTKNYKALLNKIKEFPRPEAAQRLALIPKKFGNDNAAIVGKALIIDDTTGEILKNDIHKTVIYYLWMNIGKANKEYKDTLYNRDYVRIMEELKVDKIVSYRTFCAHTDQLYAKVMTSFERHGSKAFNTAYNTYVSAEKLQYSNSMWAADGSGFKLAYAHNGKVATLYGMRIYDVASGACIGYDIVDGTEKVVRGGKELNIRSYETIPSFQRALKMAFETSNGYAAVDFLSDNHGVFTEAIIKQKLETLFPIVRTIAPGNSQENPAELYIKLTNAVGRRYGNWANSSFAAQSEQSTANPDNFFVEDLPNRDQAFLQAVELIEAYNNQKGADGLSPLERYNLNRNPKSLQPSEQAKRYAFGWETKKNLANCRGFITVEKSKKEYQFEMPNYEQTLEKIAKKVGFVGDVEIQCFYTENALDIYTLTGEYIETCNIVAKAHKSIAEATETSHQNLQRMKERKQRFVGAAEDFTQEVFHASQLLPYEIRAREKRDVKELTNTTLEADTLSRVVSKQPRKEAKAKAFDDL